MSYSFDVCLFFTKIMYELCISLCVIHSCYSEKALLINNLQLFEKLKNDLIINNIIVCFYARFLAVQALSAPFVVLCLT
jgi:hypothetical protein